MPIADRFAYFDHAAVGPMSGPAADALRTFADQAARLGDTVWPDWNATLGSVRRSAADLLHATPGDVCLIPNTTTGINLIAEGFPWHAGDNVVLPDGEFPSNLFPWQNQRSRGVEVRIVPRRSGRVEVEDLIDACDERTRIIAVSWVGYATGFRVDIAGLVDAAHRRGVRVFLDAIQGLGIYPLDVSATPVDFLAADGHKWLLGPEGLGVAMIRAEHQDTIRVGNVGWASVRDSHNYADPTFRLRGDATRFESGSGNMAGASALSASLKMFVDVVETHGKDAVASRVIDVTDEVRRRLSAAGAVTPGADTLVEFEPVHRSGIVTFELPGVEPAQFRRVAADRDVVVSCRGGGVRVACHVYNNDDDIDRLMDVVRTFV